MSRPIGSPYTASILTPITRPRNSLSTVVIIRTVIEIIATELAIPMAARTGYAGPEVLNEVKSIRKRCHTITPINITRSGRPTRAIAAIEIEPANAPKAIAASSHANPVSSVPYRSRATTGISPFESGNAVRFTRNARNITALIVGEPRMYETPDLSVRNTGSRCNGADRTAMLTPATNTAEATYRVVTPEYAIPRPNCANRLAPINEPAIFAESCVVRVSPYAFRRDPRGTMSAIIACRATLSATRTMPVNVAMMKTCQTSSALLSASVMTVKASTARIERSPISMRRRSIRSAMTP